MLEKIPSLLRSTARNILAILFWMHAFGLLGLLHVPVGNAFLQWLTGALNTANLNPTEAAILAVILFYSLIAEKGWASLFYDICFILLFPFSRVITLMWPGVKWTFRRMYPELRKNKETDTVFRAASDDVSKTKFRFQQLAKYLLNPLQRFSALWCVLIIFSTNHFVEGLAFVALCLAIIAVAKNLLFLFDDSDSWELEIKKDYEEFATKFLSDLDAVKDDPRKRLPHMLTFLTMLILMGIMASERWLKILTRTMLVAVLFPYYEYLSVLLSFVYYEVAKIHNVAWTWLDALITSLFMPATFSRIPAGSKTLLILGGIHAVFALVVGVEILLKRARAKAERLRMVFKDIVEGEHTKRVSEQIHASTQTATPAIENPNLSSADREHAAD